MDSWDYPSDIYIALSPGHSTSIIDVSSHEAPNTEDRDEARGYTHTKFTYQSRIACKSLYKHEMKLFSA